MFGNCISPLIHIILTILTVCMVLKEAPHLQEKVNRSLGCAFLLLSLQKGKIRLQMPPLSKKRCPSWQAALQRDHELLQLYLLCGRYLHLWLGFDRGRGTLGWEGRKDEKSFSLFIHVKVELCYIWSVFAESPASPGQTLFLIYRAFPQRPEVMTIHGNKISRSGAGLHLWILLQSYARDHYTLWSAMRLEKKTLIDDQRPGCGRS